jgi:hypothetical protein
MGNLPDPSNSKLGKFEKAKMQASDVPNALCWGRPLNN